MTTIINLFGGPSIGKSTLAASLFAEYKRLGINCELTREYAKECAWRDEYHKLDRNIHNQLVLFAEQTKRINELNNQVDIIITDSPILLCAVYKPNPEWESMQHTIIDMYNSYNNIDVMLPRTFNYETSGRRTTYKEALKKDQYIRRAIARYSTSDITIDYDNTYNLAHDILNKLESSIIF